MKEYFHTILYRSRETEATFVSRDFHSVFNCTRFSGIADIQLYDFILCNLKCSIKTCTRVEFYIFMYESSVKSHNLKLNV